jgi:biopolymer transport protein ExbD
MRSRQISRPDKMGFSVVFAIVIAAILIIGITVPEPIHRTAVDLPKAYSPTKMREADRADALVVVVMRDGTVFFGSEKLNPDSLADKVRQRLKPDVEKKVYIEADARVPYVAVVGVLKGVRDAGIQNVAFIVDTRKR